MSDLSDFAGGLLYGAGYGIGATLVAAIIYFPVFGILYLVLGIFLPDKKSARSVAAFAPVVLLTGFAIYGNIIGDPHIYLPLLIFWLLAFAANKAGS